MSLPHHVVVDVEKRNRGHASTTFTTVTRHSPWDTDCKGYVFRKKRQGRGREYREKTESQDQDGRQDFMYENQSKRESREIPVFPFPSGSCCILNGRRDASSQCLSRNESLKRENKKRGISSQAFKLHFTIKGILCFKSINEPFAETIDTDS